MSIAHALLVASTLVVPLQQEREYRQVTFQGCVQATSDPDLYLLAVPARFPDPVRGIATGEPVPEGANVGPKPRPDPLTTPPKFPEDEPGLPQGRYETRTSRHRTFKLTEVDGGRMRELIGAHVKVSGEIPVEGFPSGDLPAPSRNTAGADRSPHTELRVRELTRVADTCTPPFENR